MKTNLFYFLKSLKRHQKIAAQYFMEKYLQEQDEQKEACSMPEENEEAILSSNPHKYIYYPTKPN